ncbi:hypothetical protein HZA73_06120 [candidate division TA06 bacterium]|nr:hypothetical protein [candidate division TA06 bacterium]
MKKLAVVLLLVAVMAGMASAAGYKMGQTYVGPLVGLGWHDLMLGGQFEYGFHEKISGGAILGWSSESEDYYWAEYTYTYIAIGAQGNYHFKPGEKFDPFVGAVLGYDIVSWDAEYAAGYGDWYDYDASASAMFFGGTLGCNYDFSPTMVGTARLGYPYYLSAGVSFKF